MSNKENSKYDRVKRFINFFGLDNSFDDDLNDDSDDVISNESTEEETDDSDGWAEYIEEEFGDSLENSDDSKEQD